MWECISGLINVHRKRGKRKGQNQPLEVHELIIQKVEDSDNYKYLGINKSVRINDPLNKEQMTKEYKARVKKIWNSELSGNNKVIAHNSFAVPILLPTFGILNWTKKEISDLHIMTRKIMNMNGGFHTAGDVDRLYVKREKGGRGLRNVEDMYEIQTVGLKKHRYLDEVSKKHSLLSLVEKHEKDKIGRLGEEFIQRCKEFQESTNVKQGIRKEHENSWKEKWIFTKESRT